MKDKGRSSVLCCITDHNCAHSLEQVFTDGTRFKFLRVFIASYNYSQFACITVSFLSRFLFNTFLAIMST